jgi:hypothetical protein
MSGWMICFGVGAGLVVAFFAWVAWMRGSQGRHRARVRAAVRAYVEKRGGTFTLEPDGIAFRVKGPLGAGRETGTALDVMCQSGDEAKWETSIGFVMRKYIPDAFDERFAADAKKRLETLGPSVAALSDEELRARLRVKIVGTRTPKDGLATCATPLAGRFESRVVVDGVDLDGIPQPVRVRLSETDAQLHALALAATLPAEVPDASAGRASTWLWVLRPEAIFGRTPHLFVVSGRELVWMPVTPGEVETRLLSLCRAAGQDGPAKYVLWSWDGSAVGAETIVVHTILGPTTPDFTLRVPPAFHATLGIHPASDGTFGVKRARA